jgi:hypothetical protein
MSHRDLRSTVYPNAHDIYRDLIEPATLQVRSLIVKCCQAQYVPHPDTPSTLLTLCNPHIVIHAHRNPIRSYTLVSLLQEYQHWITSPLRSAVTLDLCRFCPVDALEIAEARIKSWNKEVLCCENRWTPDDVNWDVLFSGHVEDIHKSLLPGVPPNPRMAMMFRGALKRFRDKISGRLLYPRMTHKNMSRDTRREFEHMSGRVGALTDVPIFGQDDYLRYHNQSGIYLGGACEMRQKWYPSGMKPRTYYCQGGEAYQHSMHLQGVFTELVNSWPITHHVSRLQPSRVVIPVNAWGRIYDLSSFTSNCTVQRMFNERLAEKLYGTFVMIVDSREGAIWKDLGDLLFEYNRHCVVEPAVSYERLPNAVDTLIADHGTASMLGIFGNLMSCTMAHGGIVAQAVDNDAELNIAGDDGQVAEQESNSDAVHLCISAVGDYELTKTFDTREPGCICLKRPISQEGQRFQTKLTIIPPTLSLIGFLLFDIVDPRFSFIQEPESMLEATKVSIVGKDMMRFLRSLFRAAEYVDDDEIEIALRVYHGISKKFRLKPSLPQCGGPYFWPLFDSELILVEDPLISLVNRCFTGYCIVPVQEYSEPDIALGRSFVGETFDSNKSQHLVYLEKLGFLISDRVEKYLTGMDAYDALLKLYHDFSTPLLYRFTIHRDIPPHLCM